MCSIEVAFSLHLHTPSSVDAYGLQHISEDAYRNLYPCLLQVASARAAGYLHPTGYLALTRLWLPGGHASRDLYPARAVLRFIVRAALDSCP